MTDTSNEILWKIWHGVAIDMDMLEPNTTNTNKREKGSSIANGIVFKMLTVLKNEES